MQADPHRRVPGTGCTGSCTTVFITVLVTILLTSITSGYIRTLLARQPDTSSVRTHRHSFSVSVSVIIVAQAISVVAPIVNPIVAAID
jgi:hypothetical protein